MPDTLNRNAMAALADESIFDKIKRFQSDMRAINWARCLTNTRALYQKILIMAIWLILRIT